MPSLFELKMGIRRNLGVRSLTELSANVILPRSRAPGKYLSPIREKETLAEIVSTLLEGLSSLKRGDGG
jgi:hypothetical protein